MKKLSIILLLLLALIIPQAAFAQSGKDVVQQLVTLFSGWSGDDDDRSIFDAAAKHIDYQSMAEQSIGDAHWNKLSSPQKREFVSVLRQLIETRYYPRWHRIFYRGKVDFVSEANTNHELWVKTDLTVGKKQTIVTWRMHPGKNGDWTVISLTVGEKDLLTRMTSRFQNKMAKEGFEGLIVWLRDKLDLDPNDSVSSTSMMLL